MNGYAQPVDRDGPVRLPRSMVADWVTIIAQSERLAAESQQLIAESISSRIGYHVTIARAPHEDLAMECILCDRKGDKLHAMIFRLRELGRTRGYPLTNDLRANLVSLAFVTTAWRASMAAVAGLF